VGQIPDPRSQIPRVTPRSHHADDLERLELAIETPERVDLPIVGYFRAILADHPKADDLIGPQYLRVPVVVQLAMAKRFIGVLDPSAVEDGDLDTVRSSSSERCREDGRRFVTAWRARFITADQPP
jgi:hypothetical protein